MLSPSTLLSVAEAAGIVALGLSSTYFGRRSKDAAEQTVVQTKATGNGFAAAVRGDLTAIRAHLAAQDMHMVAQDEAVADLKKIVSTHGKALDSLMPDSR